MKSRGRHRQERVATLIRQILAQALTTRVKDPRVALVTVTEVTMSADLSHATARVSVMGSDEDKEQALNGLESARGFLRSVIAGAADLRITPDLHFTLDRGLEHASRLDALLKDLKRSEPRS